MWDFIKSILASRGVQLLARGVGIGFTWLSGQVGVIIAPEALDVTTQTIAAVVMASVFFGIDFLSHKWQRKDDEIRTRNYYGGDYRGMILLAVMLGGGLLALPGCNGAAVVGAVTEHIDSAGVTYDSVTGQWGVNVNLKDPAAICAAQKRAAELNYRESCRRRDADLKATDRIELQRIKDAPCEYVPLPSSPPISLANPPAPVADLLNTLARNRVLLIGCNYPGTSAALNECVNDTKRDAAGFQKHYGIKPGEIRFLHDKECTAENVRAAVIHTFSGVLPLDKRAVCISGHGAEDVDPVTGKIIDLFVTYDMVAVGWGAEHKITPDFWRDVLKPIPAGANVFIKMDICHAGGAIRPLLNSGRLNRSIDGPPDVQARVAAATQRDNFRDTIGTFNATFVAACGANQLSEETSTTGGACTFYFWSAADALSASASGAKLTSLCKQQLRANAFSQSPECKGLGIQRPLFQ